MCLLGSPSLRVCVCVRVCAFLLGIALAHYLSTPVRGPSAIFHRPQNKNEQTLTVWGGFSTLPGHALLDSIDESCQINRDMESDAFKAKLKSALAAAAAAAATNGRGN